LIRPSRTPTETPSDRHFARFASVASGEQGNAIVLSLGIITILLPLAIAGVLGLAAVVLVHEVAKVIVIGLRAARSP